MNTHASCARHLIVPILLMVGLGCASSGKPQAQTQKHFPSPQAASDSLVGALRANDHARLKQILGPAGDDIVSSGDQTADRSDVARFLALYDANHRIESGQDGVSTLILGPDDWPFPVPIVKSGGGYVFDTENGKEEILNRRIGRNELDAQQVCLAIADAQREYVKLNPTGGALPEYARKVVSDPGKKNGLFWPTAEGDPASPLGPLAASASAEGYGSTASANPYHGYCYRLLTSQGRHAQGGAIDYVVGGRLIGGFAVVAYPAQYGNSGIMTFITNHDGIVYQRDLGPDTEQAAKRMVEFDPGPEWSRTADAAQLSQSE